MHYMLIHSKVSVRDFASFSGTSGIDPHAPRVGYQPNCLNQLVMNISSLGGFENSAILSVLQIATERNYHQSPLVEILAF